MCSACYWGKPFLVMHNCRCWAFVGSSCTCLSKLLKLCTVHHEPLQPAAHSKEASV